ncbi:MAG: peroxiredoxin [Alphaproteobacteria bacterium]|nr:peroxiredoxin [Alphaproteobacteria bacterium SS10]
MLTVGDQFPAFALKAVVSRDPDNAVIELTERSHPGKWKVIFFWPKDFSTVCPTELIGFGDLNAAFEERGAVLYGASTDSDAVHRAWREHELALRDMPYPMISDIKRELSEALGILHPDEGVCLRATYILDPDNRIRHVSVYDLLVGRNPQEVLRTLDALQTDEKCPCNWQRGEATATVA